MNTKYPVYFGHKPYYITNHLTPRLNELTQTANTIIINHPMDAHIPQSIRELEKGPAEAVIILTSRVDHFWGVFRQSFVAITAGGGVVHNEHDAVLFIYRRGKWDLPKGKLDEGETIEACALREVKEETGLKEVSVEKYLGNTYHTYYEKGMHVLKTTTWYKMKAPGAQMLVPQMEEDIEEMEWVSAENRHKVLGNTFPAIPQLLALLDA